MSKMLTISEVMNGNYNDELLEDIIIDDDELLCAIIDYQKGKIMENEAKKLIDEKLHQNKIKSACTENCKISCIEYDTTRFDTTRFKTENPNMYNMFTTRSTLHKYKIDAIIDMDVKFNNPKL